MPRSLPLLARIFGALLEAVPVDDLLRPRHVGGEFAGVVDLAGRGLVRHRLRPDEILPPQRVRRDADLARGGIDQPLDHIGRFGPAGAAIGIDRHGVGVGRAHADEAGRDIVDAGRHRRAEIGNVRRVGRQIRAHVGDGIDVEREEFALVVKRQLRGRDVVAALRVAEKMLGAVARSISPACPVFFAATAASAYSR